MHKICKYPRLFSHNLGIHISTKVMFAILRMLQKASLSIHALYILLGFKKYELINQVLNEL